MGRGSVLQNKTYKDAMCQIFSEVNIKPTFLKMFTRESNTFCSYWVALKVTPHIPHIPPYTPKRYYPIYPMAHLGSSAVREKMDNQEIIFRRRKNICVNIVDSRTCFRSWIGELGSWFASNSESIKVFQTENLRQMSDYIFHIVFVLWIYFNVFEITT